MFGWFHLFERLWRHVGMRDIVEILKAVTLSPLVFSTTVLLMFGGSFPTAVLPLDWLLCLALVGDAAHGSGPPGVERQVLAERKSG